MADEPHKPKPNLTERAEAAKREREARLAGALRANLRRRKTGEAPRSDKGVDEDRNGNG